MLTSYSCLKRKGFDRYFEEIDEKLINMIKSMRESGAVINYNNMIAIAKGIVTANDRNKRI